MTMLIAFTYETGKITGDDSDYWVNNACLRIWPRLSLLLVLHFVEWFIYSMSVNPVPSVGDVIFLMYYTCCTPGEKQQHDSTFYYFSFLLVHILYIHNFSNVTEASILKYTFIEREEKIIDACSSSFSLLLTLQIAGKLFCLCHSLKPCL